MTGRVLIVEDDAPVREALGQTLELAGLEVTLAGAFIVAKDIITPGFDGVVVSDIRMPGRDGMYLLDYVRQEDPDLPVILLTGEGDIPMAVDAMNRGAFDFLEKPCPTEKLVSTIRRGLQARGLVLENRHLRAQLAEGDAASRLIFGTSALAERLRDEVRQIARFDGSVLIMAAPGSGVSKVAEVIHLLSGRVTGPFVKHGSARLTPDELGSALQAAEGGSLFLDEVGHLPDETQYALLDALEDGSATRVIAGTSRDLLAPVGSGEFSADLYYRLEAMTVRIPALKERPEDIPVLFRHYVAQACEQAGVPERAIGSDVLASLMSRDWPGNARALMNAAMRFALGLDTEDDREEMGLAERMAQIESAMLIDALRRNGGNASATAEYLKLPRKTLYDKFTKYRIRPEDFR